MSDAGNYPLEIEQGATLRRSFQWVDENGATVDLTGCHIRARVFARGVPNRALELTDEDNDFVVRDQSESADTGWFDLELTDERTDALYWHKGSWRLDILHPDGSVTAFLEGPVTVTPRTGETA